MIVWIGNKGQLIENTDYWNTETARKGFCFLSWNAGAGRLLLPEVIEGALREMRTADHVIVSRGRCGGWGREALEVLFDDHSDSPFCLHMSAEQTDRVVPAEDCGRKFPFTVWTPRGMQLQRPGYYRRVSAIPCLEPWPRPLAKPRTSTVD